MALDLTNFDDPTLDADYVTYLVEQEALDAQLHYGRLWDYFRNPAVPALGPAADACNAASRPYVQAQEAGLPARITGVSRLGIGGEQPAGTRKEVVIENDIAWRIHTMVDFLFGKPVSIRSLARDRATAEAVEAVIAALFEANGSEVFFQELALLGAVHGFVDVVLRAPADFPPLPQGASSGASTARAFSSLRSVASPSPSPAGGLGASGAALPATSPGGDSQDAVQDPSRARSRPLAQAREFAARLTLETVEAPRVLPILDENDFRTVRYWVQCFRKQTAKLDTAIRPFASWGWAGRRDAGPRTVEVVEILGPRWWQRYEDRALVAEGPNPLGQLPVVHIQNLSLPGEYAGLSDVEPLAPLQDELNTRLSDRASRVTYQSFKMYLAKGIDDFLERPVGPGQMWATHNPDAAIQEFGHDAGSPSEAAHVAEVRQALDKVSGVTPLAAGLIQGAVGHLTSATALKVLLSGLLSRTARKRITYGRGVGRIVELVLALLDSAGVLPTAPEDRRIELHWPSPLPEDEAQRLADAQAKAALGVPAATVLAELGYDRQHLAETPGP